MPQSDALLTADRLGLVLGGRPVFSGLSFRIGPGLNFVRGGDGRGKTSLLRLMAGQLQPSSGSLHRAPAAVWWTEGPGSVPEDVQALAWLQAQQRLHSGWNEPLASELAQAWDLQAHLHKPLFMLSTGSRRKLGLVAAVASGAGLTLLDTPHAALDGKSRRVLDEVLQEATHDTRRAWVVADGAVPSALTGPLQLIELGD
jgi:ABC-type transport system involved in cytochrome c biogenesis ATPase subunit